MQTSTGIFRGQEATNRFENFQKAHNFPSIVALEICIVDIIMAFYKRKISFWLVGSLSSLHRFSGMVGLES
uniref:Uncharacterized protein n=1 Tax=Noccaea caerulescens TaxID=107243 RepID=A0A1J3G5I9_NOCCA